MIGRADRALLECGKLLSCLETYPLRPALFNRFALDAAARMHQFDHERETDVLALWRSVLDNRVGVGSVPNSTPDRGQADAVSVTGGLGYALLIEARSGGSERETISGATVGSIVGAAINRTAPSSRQPPSAHRFPLVLGPHALRWMAACDDIRRSVTRPAGYTSPLGMRRIRSAGGSPSTSIYDDPDGDGFEGAEIEDGDTDGDTDFDDDAGDDAEDDVEDDLSGDRTAPRWARAASSPGAAEEPYARWIAGGVISQLAVGVYRAARRNVPRSAIVWASCEALWSRLGASAPPPGVWGALPAPHESRARFCARYARSLASQASSAYATARAIETVRADAIEALSPRRRAAHGRFIVDALLSLRLISPALLAEMTGLSLRGAALALDGLVSDGVAIDLSGRANYRRFALARDIETLEMFGAVESATISGVGAAAPVRKAVSRNADQSRTFSLWPDGSTNARIEREAGRASLQDHETGTDAIEEALGAIDRAGADLDRLLERIAARKES